MNYDPINSENNQKLKKMKRRTWIYLAFKDDENDYPHSPYFYKIFYNHLKMKNWGAEFDAVEREKYPNYCSTYLTFDKE